MEAHTGRCHSPARSMNAHLLDGSGETLTSLALSGQIFSVSDTVLHTSVCLASIAKRFGVASAPAGE